MKKILLLTLLCISCWGCDSSEEPGQSLTETKKEITGIEIYNSLKSFKAGDVSSLKLLLIYTDGTKSEQLDNVNWSSTDASVATVSSSGEVQFLKAGECAIKAKYLEFLSELNIKVIEQQTNHVIKISEVLYDATGTDTGKEYIEIYNSSNAAVDLTGYKLIDGDLKSKEFIFAAGTVLEPKCFLVIAQKQDIFIQSYNITNLTGDFSYSLNNNGETIQLKNPQDELIDILYIEAGSKDFPADAAWGSTGICKTKSGMSLQRDLTVPDSDTELDWYEGEVTPGK